MDKLTIGAVAVGVTVMAFVLFFAVYNFGRLHEQQEIKRKCEQYEVVDLPLTGSMFYCAREKK